jgi:hypothetical protein
MAARRLTRSANDPPTANVTTSLSQGNSAAVGVGNAAVAVLHFSKLNARKRPHHVRCKELAASSSAGDSPGL